METNSASDYNRQFSAFVHGWEGEGTRACSIRPGDSGLELHLDGLVKNISATRLAISYGGPNSKMIIMRVESVGSNSEFSIMIKDKTFLKHWYSLNPGPGVREKLEALGADKSSKNGRGWLLFLGIALGAVVLFFAARFVYGSMVNGIANAVPPRLQVELGRASAQQFKAGGKSLEDSEYADYIRDLGAYLEEVHEEISGEDRYDYEFSVIDDPTINALALPGGFIFVNSGLINAAQSSDEIAGVLAHEIIHVSESHGLKNLINRAGLGIVAAVVIGDVNGVVQLLIANAAQLGSLAYGRTQESEADELGLELVYQAGFDPVGFVDFFHRLLAQEESAAGAPELFSTHPQTDGRVDAVSQTIEQRGQPEEYWTLRIEFNNRLDALKTR